MRQIQNAKLLNFYLREYRIEDYFETKHLPFRLYQYDAGDLLNLHHSPVNYLKFIVKGSFDIYSVRVDGTRYFLKRGYPLFVLGVTEFCGAPDTLRYHEAVEQVFAIELPLQDLRPILWKDNCFLRFLLLTMAQQITELKSNNEGQASLEDALLFYIRHECPNLILTNMDDTAFRLNRSRRQLQRVLVSLTARGVLQKIGKGKYIISSNYTNEAEKKQTDTQLPD